MNTVSHRLDDIVSAEPGASFADSVRIMAETVQSHPALDNRFYNRWMDRRLRPDQVELLAVNFSAWTAPTVVRIAVALANMTDGRSRFETVHNLQDELGGGDFNSNHVLLLRRFFDWFLGGLYGREFRLDESRAEVLPATRRLNEGAMELFADQRPPVAAGALLAQEWHAYPQLVNLYEGVRNYKDLFDLYEFHENCGYYYIHIGEAEKEHKEQSIISAARCCRDVRDLQLLKKGFYGVLDLLSCFWDDLYEAIVSAEQDGSPSGGRNAA